MTKYLNKIICVAIAVMIASPASAAITDINRVLEFWNSVRNPMYFGHQPKDESIYTPNAVYKCDATQGTYSTVPAGMECGTQKFKGGTTCYVNCLCSKTKFPFAVTEEDREKFVLPTSKADMCTDSTGTYYASVACAEGYYSRTELNKVPMSMWFNYGTPIVATNRRGKNRTY